MSVIVVTTLDNERLGIAVEKIFERFRKSGERGTRLAQAAVLGRIREELRQSSIIGLGDNQPSAWRSLPVESTPDGYRGSLATRHPMGKFRDTGGTVKPGKSVARAGPNKGKPTKALTIPMARAKTKLRQAARAGRVATAGGASQFGKLRAEYFPPKTTGNGSIIVGRLVEENSPRGKRSSALFLLARRVVVPPYPYMLSAVQAALPDIKKAMVLALKDGDRASA